MTKSKRTKEQLIEDVLHIDEFNLDKEWIEQPLLFFKWSAKVAEAKEKVDELKNQLNVCKAELNRSIRSDPDEYGLTKATEASVAAAIPEQEEYIEIEEELRNAYYNLNIFQSAVAALEHKKRALEKLVDLHGMNYFSEPRTGNDNFREGVNEVNKRKARTKRKRRKQDV